MSSYNHFRHLVRYLLLYRPHQLHHIYSSITFGDNDVTASQVERPQPFHRNIGTRSDRLIALVELAEIYTLARKLNLVFGEQSNATYLPRVIVLDLSNMRISEDEDDFKKELHNYLSLCHRLFFRGKILGSFQNIMITSVIDKLPPAYRNERTRKFLEIVVGKSNNYSESIETLCKFIHSMIDREVPIPMSIVPCKTLRQMELDIISREKISSPFHPLLSYIMNQWLIRNVTVPMECQIACAIVEWQMFFVTLMKEITGQSNVARFDDLRRANKIAMTKDQWKSMFRSTVFFLSRRK
jgi:hypothetical protein